MILGNRNIVACVLVVLGLCMLAAPVTAATPIAKVASFSGEVYILSGASIVPVDKIGQVVNDGDNIQTKEGELQLTFNDGAVMKIHPYSASMIQEREESSGMWFFKTKKLVRRMTAFVGKLYFKSGASKRENLLQTPTAVCALRGSAAEAGYMDGISLLNLIVGAAEKAGQWEDGPFDNPGIGVATRSAVWQEFSILLQAYIDSLDTALIEDQKAFDSAMARYALAAGRALENHPDPMVRAEAQKIIGESKKVPTTTTTTTSTSTTTTILPEGEEPPPSTVEPPPPPTTVQPPPPTTVQPPPIPPPEPTSSAPPES